MVRRDCQTVPIVVGPSVMYHGIRRGTEPAPGQCGGGESECLVSLGSRRSVPWKPRQVRSQGPLKAWSNYQSVRGDQVAHKTKILHVITGLGVGGAESMLYKVASRLDSSRFESVVVSLQDEGSVGLRLRAAGVPVYELHMGRGRVSLRALWSYLEVVRHERPEIVHTWMYHANLLGLIGSVIVRSPNLVWSIRRTDPSADVHSVSARVVYGACAMGSRWPEAIVVNSRAGQQAHRAKGYRARRWVLLPNGFDLEMFSPDAGARVALREELRVGTDAFLIGTVGRFAEAKDHGTFLRAAGELVALGYDAHFVLAGRDMATRNSRLTSMIGPPDLAGRIHFLGDREDIPRVMAALDIYTSTSTTEGFPNVIGEAMSCGIPCVVTDAGDSADVVGDTGLVVSVRDVNAIVKAWEALLRSPDTRMRNGNAARRRVEKRYNLPAIVREYESFYDSLGL
jgi:glycosyltransferase involved in cell wall biosynthesis